MVGSYMRCFVLSCVLLAYLPYTVQGEPPDPAVGRLHIFKHADLVIAVPPGWKAESKWGVRRTSPPTMKITGPGHPLDVLITPIWSTSGDAGFNSLEEVRKSANLASKDALKDAKETSITLLELNGEHAHGFYYTLTEKVSPAGSYEYLTNAFLGIGDLLVTATILHHQKDSDAFQQALGLLRSIDQPGVAGADDNGMAPETGAGAKPGSKSTHAPGATPIPKGLNLASPDGTWAVVLPGGFVRQSQDTNQSATALRYMAADEANGLRATVNIEPAAEPGNSTVARAAYWRKMLLDTIAKRDVTTREVQDKAIVLYVAIDKQQDMNIFLVHRNQWVNVHVTKANFSANDQALLDSVVTGIGFVDLSKPAKKQ